MEQAGKPVHKSLIENGAISKIGGVAVEAKVGVQVGVQSMESFQPDLMEGQRCNVEVFMKVLALKSECNVEVFMKVLALKSGVGIN